MEDNGLTEIVLHGALGEKTGQKVFKIKIDSLSEGLRAIDVLSNRRFTRTIFENEKQNIKYKVLADGKNLFSKSIDKPEDAKDSEMFVKKKMKKIDIVPVFEGAGSDDKDALLIVGGALMIGAGIAMGSPMLIQLGLFALITGLANMLSEPPEFEDFREIQQTNKRESYLFNGPINTYNPGGPVPIGYGRILVGSLAIAFAQNNQDKKIYDNGVWYPN